MPRSRRAFSHEVLYPYNALWPLRTMLGDRHSSASVDQAQAGRKQPRDDGETLPASLLCPGDEMCAATRGGGVRHAAWLSCSQPRPTRSAQADDTAELQPNDKGSTKPASGVGAGFVCVS